MDLDTVSQAVSLDTPTFSFLEALTVSQNLAIRVFAIAIYAVFVYKFYRSLAQKDIFALDLSPRSGVEPSRVRRIIASIFLVLKYIFLFPIAVFLWFAVLGVLLILLTESGSVDQVLLIAISLVGAVRVTAYFSEDLSQDLAKMIPFALLGVFLSDTINFDLNASLGILYELPNHATLAGYYFLFIVVLEAVLRSGSAGIKLIRRKPRADHSVEAEE